MKKILLFSFALAMFAGASAANGQVIESRKMSNGAEMQMLRGTDGMIVRRLVKPESQAAVKAPVVMRADEAETETTFYEGFEGWDEALGFNNWIPEGWEEINTEANTPTEEQLAHNINNSWYVYTSSNLYQELTTDGVNECFIHFAYNGSYGTTAAAQNEWLVTPSVTLADNETLHFMLQADFFNVYNCDDFDWTNLVYPTREVVNTLTVMIKEDGGEWAPIWDLAEDVASQMTDRECYDASDLVIRHYDINLAAYNGKNVKIAFRYIRKEGNWYGNSMILDGVRIDHPKAAATGIESATNDNAEAEYFNLQGVRVNHDAIENGVLIRRQGNQSSKILVK